MLEKMCCMAEWSKLPDDLLRLIVERLTFIPDFHRFASVCMQWRLIALAGRHIFPPLLMLPFDEATSTCNFFSFCEKEVVRIHLPKLHQRVCCTTSHGWLITLDDELDITLLHPFSRAQIHLSRHPGHSEFLYYIWREESIPMRFYLRKAVLSANPISSYDSIVAGLCNCRDELAFCRLGDEEWTIISDVNSCTDVIFYDDKIYAVDYAPSVFICEVCPDPQVTTIGGPEVTRFGQDSFFTYYLVESLGGDLLCIARSIVFPDDSNGGDYKTHKFQVFRLDRSTTEWIRVSCLGDQLLFLGGNHSFALSATDFRQYGRNCIYFTDDHLDRYRTNPYGCHDAGVFSLEDESVDSYYPNAPFWPTPPIWYAQTPVEV